MLSNLVAIFLEVEVDDNYQPIEAQGQFAGLNHSEFFNRRNYREYRMKREDGASRLAGEDEDKEEKEQEDPQGEAPEEKDQNRHEEI